MGSEVEFYAKSSKMIESANLFIPIEKGKREKGKLVRWENRSKTNKLEVRMWEALDILDQDLFLVILSKLADFDYGKLINKTTDYDLMSTLTGVDVDNANYMTLKMTITSYDLLKSLKRNTGKNDYNRLEASLIRLANTSIFWKTEQESYNSSLLTFRYFDKTKKLTIAINLLSAFVLFGSNISYIKHDLNDRARLKSNLQKAIHSYFSRLININDIKAFKIDTIVSNVYDDNNVTRDRRYRLKKSLDSFFKKTKNFKIKKKVGNSIYIERLN